MTCFACSKLRLFNFISALVAPRSAALEVSSKSWWFKSYWCRILRFVSYSRCSSTLLVGRIGLGFSQEKVGFTLSLIVSIPLEPG